MVTDIKDVAISNGHNSSKLKYAAHANGNISVRVSDVYGIVKKIDRTQMDIDAELFANVANESISKAIGNPDKQRTLDMIPHALVCTVAQNLNKAEGYVFKSIENVTIDRGLPGTSAGMPSPTNDDTCTVAQLYDAVKKIARSDGGLKYSDSERTQYLFHDIRSQIYEMATK